MRTLPNVFTAAKLTAIDFTESHSAAGTFGPLIAAVALRGAAGDVAKKEIIDRARERMAQANEAHTLAMQAQQDADAATKAGDFETASQYLKVAKQAQQVVSDFIDVEGFDFAQELCAAIQIVYDASKEGGQEGKAKDAFQYFRSELLAVTGARIVGDKNGIYTVIDGAHPARVKVKKAARAKSKAMEQSRNATAEQTTARIAPTEQAAEVRELIVDSINLDTLMRAAIAKCANVAEFEKAALSAIAWFTSQQDASKVA